MTQGRFGERAFIEPAKERGPLGRKRLIPARQIIDFSRVGLRSGAARAEPALIG